MITREMIDSAIPFTANNEGFRSVPYKDTTGNLTVAYGRNLMGNPMTKEEGLYLLTNDINRVYRELMRIIPWFLQLNTARKVALCDMAFNIGVAGFMQFKTFLGLVQRCDWQGAYNDLLAQKWAYQVGVRAKRVANLILKGEF